ncbi:MULTISPECIES: tyrosine-type recombinase/integrase [Thermomonosporaceae]|uniref:tyrosine-type recombinase/integrase n=1 Tax=Thermomonosporaceae TaxID=2012 RepID=UPI00255B0F5A|nr:MULTISPECIES: tyrosine-type recombinase/integrase [Thermomonosporaceae]MDL4773143.1 tyrosine-type recombinase/integrase [Actinomadura xylanilytica]
MAIPASSLMAVRSRKRANGEGTIYQRKDGRYEGAVFVPTTAGTDNLRRSWGRVRGAAGLGSVRFHDIRYTCVSLLLALGVAPNVVKEIVGHSDIEVTMTIYAHTSLEDKRAALRKLGDVLG